MVSPDRPDWHRIFCRKGVSCTLFGQTPGGSDQLDSLPLTPHYFARRNLDNQEEYRS